MSSMLLQLPKDLLTYILSIVVFETYITQVSPFVRSTFLIDELTRPGAFTCFVDNSITMVPIKFNTSFNTQAVVDWLQKTCWWQQVELQAQFF